MSEPRAGTLISGRYRLLSLLSKDEPGARTFRAEHPGERRALRLTVYEVLHPPEPTQVERFAEALRAAERLNHPAFPPVREAGFDADARVLWSVRDTVPGEVPLALVLRRAVEAEGLSLPWLLHLESALAGALRVLHRARGVHGRLRPNRVHCVPAAEGARVLVEGLGLEEFRRAEGRQLLALQDSGSEFLAPELAQPGPLTHATDLYGLGALVRELSAASGSWAPMFRAWYGSAMAPQSSRRGTVDSQQDTLRFLFSSEYERHGAASGDFAPPRPPTEEPLFAQAPVDFTAEEELNPEPLEDRSPEGMARFEDFVEAFTRALPGAPPQPVPDGVDFSTESGLLHLRQSTVEVDGLRWAVPVYRRLGDVEGFVEVVLETARRCAGPPRHPAREELEAALQRLDLDGDLSVKAGPEHLTMRYSRETWVSSHETGWVEREYAWLPYARLPADVDGLTAVLRDTMRVATMLLASPRLVCRYCRGTFGSLDFSVDSKACHSCANRYLGVVY